MMQTVARRQDVPQDRGLEIEVGGDKILLVRDGDAIRAFAGTCPHAGAPLAEGAVCDGRIVCPWHKAMFSVADGELLEPPALERLARYAIEVSGDEVRLGERLDPVRAKPVDQGRRAVIVGAGAAGAAAASALREFGFGGAIELVGREAGAPYDRTALSKFVMSGDMAADEVPPLLTDDFWQRERVTLVQAEVTRLDVAAKRIGLADGTSTAYDVALIAVGMAPKRPDLPGIELEGVRTLRDKANASAIVAGAGKGQRAVILGSSFIGLEVASALRKRGVAVAVVTPERVPFVKQMGPRLGAMFKALHERNGVVFHAETEAVRLEGSAKVASVVLKDGLAVPADVVVVGVGVRPETAFVHGLALAEDGGVPVDAGMRAGPDLFAAGDVARFPFGAAARVRIEHWRVAQQHARIAARNMAGGAVEYEGVPFFWTYHFEKRFEYLGHPTDWDEVIVDGDLDAHRFVALLVKDDAVVGAVACDRERATARLIVRMRSALPLEDALLLLGE